MGKIHIDVLTEINAASAAAGASQLEAMYGEAGRKAAEAFAANADFGGKVSLKLRQSFEEPGKKAAESFGKAFDAQFSKSMPGAEQIEKAPFGRANHARHRVRRIAGLRCRRFARLRLVS